MDDSHSSCLKDRKVTTGDDDQVTKGIDVLCVRHLQSYEVDAALDCVCELHLDVDSEPDGCGLGAAEAFSVFLGRQCDVPDLASGPDDDGVVVGSERKGRICAHGRPVQG